MVTGTDPDGARSTTVTAIATVSGDPTWLVTENRYTLPASEAPDGELGGGTGSIDARVVVGGNEFRFDDIGPGVHGKVLLETVIHGHQGIVDIQVDMALIRADVGGRRRDDLGSLQADDDVDLLAGDRSSRCRLDDPDDC